MPLRTHVGHVTASRVDIQRCSYGIPSISPTGRGRQLERGRGSQLWWGQLPACCHGVTFSPDAQHQAPLVFATSAFIFRQTTSLLSLLGCLRFHEFTSAIFSACVAFFRGRARKIIQCSVCLSSVLVGAAKPDRGCGGLGEGKLCSQRSEEWDQICQDGKFHVTTACTLNSYQ